MTLHVRHATASGRLDELWEFVAAERRVDVLVRVGKVSVPLSIHVCSQAKPRLGAHPILRIDGESWRVLPSRYVRVWPHRIESLGAIACPIGDLLGPGEQLVITNAPPHVDAELDRL